VREDDRLPPFRRYSIPPRPGTVECPWCPAHVKPQGMRDHCRVKHSDEHAVISWPSDAFGGSGVYPVKQGRLIVWCDVRTAQLTLGEIGL
jgi:hypothetical protein